MEFLLIKNRVLLFLCICFFCLKIKASYNEVIEYPYYLEEGGSICDEIYDPLEKINRKIFSLDTKLDFLTLNLVTTVYHAGVNNYLRERIFNLVKNLKTPLTVVNNILQLNIVETLNSFWSFAINTTLGIGGLYDVAGKIGLNNKPQTFGNTLAYYGVPPGPYIVLPILGMTNLRDMFDVIFLNKCLNPLYFQVNKSARFWVNSLFAVVKRDRIIEFTNHIFKNDLDPYAIIREYLWKKRQKDVIYKYKSICKINVKK